MLGGDEIDVVVRGVNCDEAIAVRLKALGGEANSGGIAVNARHAKLGECAEECFGVAAHAERAVDEQRLALEGRREKVNEGTGEDRYVQCVVMSGAHRSSFVSMRPIGPPPLA